MAITEPINAVNARICQQLADRLGPTRYGLWFDHAAQIGVHDDAVRVTVPSRFHADWISRNFTREITEVAQTAAGRALELRVEIRPDAFAEGATGRRTGSSSPSSPPTATPASRRPGRRRAIGSAFDPRYDLDRFVVGPSNALSFRAAERLCEGASSFSPLFFHGACGVGKTHLLQGIARRVERLTPGARIRYVTGEEFTNEYITALRTNQIDGFRKSLRKLDLLALDDVHFLSNKHATQNEFLCTFDAIGMMGAKIVLASDEHPRRIQSFHQRIISRFMSGMVVEVQLPDRETRRQIIERIASERRLRVNAAALDVLSERLIGSVREIEGALTRLQALSIVSAGASGDGQLGAPAEVGMILVERFFRDESGAPMAPVSVARILEAVSRKIGIESSAILGESRQKHIVFARSLVAFLARQMTTQSFPEIARAMGRRNHSTIMAAAKRIELDVADGISKSPGPGADVVPVSFLVDQLRATLMKTPRVER